MTASQNKILIVGPSWVGDMIMAQTLFKLIKSEQAETLIDVLAPAWNFPVLACMPEINEAIELPFKHGDIKLFARYAFAKKLKNKNYTQAIVLPNSLKSALIPWFANIPKRTGWLGEYRYFLLNDLRLNIKQYALMIEQYMSLGISANKILPKNYVLPALMLNQTETDLILNKHKISLDKPILALAPGAAYGSAKRWPAKYFATIANDKLIEGWQVWLFGSRDDKVIADEIMQLTQQQCRNFSGELALNETIALLSIVNGIIANDSGLLHIAAALNKPLIAIYGSTTPRFTPPLSPNAQIVKKDLACQPCFKRECPLKHHQCMEDLLPETIFQAIDQWKRDAYSHH